MAHNLTNDRSMFYAGEVPWHGLGVQLPRNGTWEEVAGAVNFYKVQEREVFVAGIPDAIASQKALVRGDTGDFLAVVGKDYGVVDFEDMARAVVTAAGGVEAVFHTGGLLGKRGARGWLLGELGEPIRVKGDESPIRRYFLATTAHTGNSSVILKNVATRVVCQNTLGSALGEREGATWSIRHTKNAAEAVQSAGIAFRNLQTGYERFGALANLLAEVKFSDGQFAQTLDAIYPVGEEGKRAKQTEEKVEALQSLWSGEAKGMNGIAGTAWAAWQAWTEYADHGRKVRALPENAGAARLESIWMGSAADLKRQSLFAILDAAGLDARKVA